jgi:hypothetical protein
MGFELMEIYGRFFVVIVGKDWRFLSFFESKRILVKL